MSDYAALNSVISPLGEKTRRELIGTHWVHYYFCKILECGVSYFGLLQLLKATSVPKGYYKLLQVIIGY